MIVTRLWQRQPGNYFCISTKSGTGAWEDHFFKREELKDVEPFIKKHHDRDIYFCPSGFSKAQRRKEFVMLPNLLWADLDEANPREILIRPTIAIESSPGRFVGLWVIDKPMNDQINRRLTYAVGADKSGWDLTQVLRVPGTNNYKYASVPRVKMLWSDGENHSLSEIERRLPKKELPPTGETSLGAEIYKKLESKLSVWARREILTAKPRGSEDRSRMLWRLENHLIEKGATREEAFAVLWSCPWNKFYGRHNGEEQLRRELEKGLNNRFANGAGERNAPRIMMRPMSEVEEEEIDWLYYPYMAIGELTIVEGDPGLGKSYLMQMISAHICDGKRMPCVKKTPVKKGKVVYFDIENSAGTVTKKRLVSNGLQHLENYIQCEEPFSIDDDDAMDTIYEYLERYRPILVVFDTVNTYLGAADAFKGHEAQQVFVRFRELAQRFNCSVVVLRHLTKSTKERALYRGQGSIAFAGMARVIVAVGTMNDDPETRVMAVSKINFARMPKALTFSIDALPDTLKEQDRSKFSWGDFVEKTADDILAAPAKGNSDRDDAKQFLEDQLADGPVESSKLEKMADARSISTRTLQRAADDLGVIKKQEGFGKTRRSMWSL
jgi:archaellum biogenesis ATPase FlaH